MSILFCPEEWVEKHNGLHIKLFSSDVQNVIWLFWKVWTAWVYSRGCLHTHTHITSNFLPVLKLTIHWLFNPIGAEMPSLKKKLCMYSSIASDHPTFDCLQYKNRWARNVHWKASEWGNRSNTVDRRGQISCIHNKIDFGFPVLTKWASLEHKACTITLPWQQTAVIWQIRVDI